MSKLPESIIASLRVDGEGDVSDLRQSMRERGFDPNLPVVTDEYGVVLMGRRRLKAAAAEGIKPTIRIISFGEGEKADIERVRLALSSNVGSKAMTAADRKHVARHIYKEHGWTQQQIAMALGVSQ